MEEVFIDTDGSLDAGGKENDASSQGEPEETECWNNDNDYTTIAGLLETCVIVWEGIKDQLDKVCELVKMLVRQSLLGMSLTKTELFLLAVKEVTFFSC